MTYPNPSPVVPIAPAPGVRLSLDALSRPCVLSAADGSVIWTNKAEDDDAGRPVLSLDVVDAAGELRRLRLDETSDEHAASATRELLAAESQHRARNIVALALAVAHQSLGDRLEDPVVQRFLDRLRSLDAVARVGCEVEGDHCPVGLIVRQVVRRFDDPEHARVTITGPELAITARWAHFLALVVHELASNAIRHGALRDHRGMVDVRWSLTHNPLQDRRSLQLLWRERNGPQPSAVARKGFGIKLLTDIPRATRRCSAAHRLLDSGLSYQLVMDVEASAVSVID